MANTIATPDILKPSKAETKFQATDNAARRIIDAEAVARDKKTARLRAARLAREAVSHEAPPPAKPVKKSAGRIRAGKSRT